MLMASEDSLAALEEAQAGWDQMGRGLDAARCLALRAERLIEEDPAEARRLSAGAAATYEALGLAHLAQRSWDLASL